jgi:alkane 1-monooxygenase
LAFTLPVATLLSLGTAPQHWYAAIPPAALLLLLAVFDQVGTQSIAAPRRNVVFELILLALAVLQLMNLGLFLRATSMMSWRKQLVSAVIMGATTGYSAIVVAHELIHRRGVGYRAIGRILLWTALYDHFYVEHLRGHHVRIAAGTDFAPARFGESVWRFITRSVPGELINGWRISRHQLGLGTAIELTLLASAGWKYGPRTVIAILLDAAVALVLITAVSYIQHWGVEMAERRMTAAQAWDCDSPLTHYALLGISRHADHHLRPGRRYQQLRASESPKLPHGYFRMIGLVLFRPAKARRLLAEALLHVKGQARTGSPASLAA